MVKAEFLLELLMRLLADPPRLDGGREPFERGLGWQVGYIVLLLPGRSPLADKPDLIARHALHAIVEHPVLMGVRNTDTASRKEACQPTSGAPSPADLLPSLTRQHGVGRDRRVIGDVILAAFAGLRDGKDQGDIGRIDVLASRKPDGPQKTALAQSLAEGPAGAVACIGKDAAKPRSRGDDTVDLFKSDLQLGHSACATLW